jgi:hypothetical protein
VSVNVDLGGLTGGVGRGARAGCGAIFGVIMGLALVPVGFYLVYHGEKRLVNHGKVFERIEMTSPDTAAQASGLVKIKGQAVGEFLSHPRWDGQALFYRATVEEYEREEDAEGEVDYDWNTVSTDEKWASFSVGSVKVAAEGANPVGEEKVYEGAKPTFAQDFSVDALSRSPKEGDQRLEVEVLDGTREVIVLGEMQDGSISGGSTFVVSTLDEAATTQALKTEYKIAYWLMKGGAVLGIWVGILLIFGPLMSIVGYIPFIGRGISAALVFGALLVAVVSVGLITLFIKLFWVLAAIVAVALVLLIWRGIASPRQAPSARTGAPGAAAGQPPIPRPAAAAAAEIKCPKCGSSISRTDKFCTECGARLDEGKLVE